MRNVISRGCWACLVYAALIACLVLQPPGTLANANKSALAPSSDFANGNAPDYPALLHQFQVLDEALNHGLFRRLGKDQPAAMHVLRMYCMALVARNAQGPLRDQILGYFKFRKWITEGQKKALARAAGAAPYKALQELCKHQKDAALADAEKMYAFWLKRGMAASDFADVYAQDLKRALDENLLTLKYGKNALPLDVFLVIQPRREKEFLNAVNMQHDDWFVQSYASEEARRAARQDIASAASKARFREKGPIEGHSYADHVAAMEADLLLPHLLPAPERAHVLAMGPQAGALLRQWIRANPEKTGRRIAVLANKRAALKARELMPKKAFPTMEFRHGQENQPPSRTETFVSRILVKGYFQGLHARRNRGAILEAIAQIDRDLAVGGTLDIIESGNTPLLLHKLLSAAGYELIQKRHVPGIVSPDGYTLLSFEKIHSKGEVFLHSMRHFPDDHWPAYFAPDYGDPADLPRARKAVSRQIADIPDPESISYPYCFPKNVWCSVRQALIHNWTKDSFRLHGLVSLLGIHDLMNEKDLRANLYAQDDEIREKIIEEIDDVLSYLDMGHGRTSRSLLRAWNLHDAVQSMLAEDGAACRELLRALEESLGRDGLLKFREDFQAMHGATTGRLNFAAKLMQTYLIEKYVNGGQVWLLPASHASVKIATEVERRRYRLPKEVHALLEKHAEKWRGEVFRHLLTDPVSRLDLLLNLGIRDPDILRTKAPLPMLLDLYALQMVDGHHTGPVTRKLLEELSGGSIARLLWDRFRKTHRWEYHEPYLRAYLLHAGGDADLTERFQALIKSHSGPAAEALKAIARDTEENIKIRQSALSQLAKARPKGMKAFLGQVLAESKEHTLIVHALWALRDLRLRLDRSLAEKISRHPDAWVRQQLARALGEVGVKSSVEILNALSSDANAQVRQAAEEALIAMAGDDHRDHAVTRDGVDIRMSWRDHEEIIDPFIQRAIRNGDVEFINERHPYGQNFLRFLKWLGKRSGHKEMERHMRKLLNSATDPEYWSSVKVLHENGGSMQAGIVPNHLPRFKKQTIVGHAGSRGIYAFVGRYHPEDEKGAPQVLMHEFGARLGMPHAFNDALAAAYAQWTEGKRSGKTIKGLLRVLRGRKKPLKMRKIMPQEGYGTRDLAAAVNGREAWRFQFEEFLREAKPAEAFALAWENMRGYEAVQYFYESLFRGKGPLSNNPDLLRTLALLYMGSGELSQAADALTHLQHFAERKDYERRLGMTFSYLKQGNVGAAIGRLNQPSSPGLALYWMYYGYMIMREGDESAYQRAQRCFESALRIEPDSVHAWRLLRLALERQGQSKQEQAIQELIAAGPSLSMDNASLENFLKTLAIEQKTPPAASAPPEILPKSADASPASKFVVDYFDPARTNVQLLYGNDLSGRFVLDRSSVPAIARVDGKPADIMIAKEAMQDVLGDAMTAYSYGNYLYNDGFVIFDGAAGKAYHRQGEPLLRRRYTMVIVWKDGRITSENVRFGPAGTGGVLRVLIGESKQDSSGLIQQAFSAIRLIRGATPVQLFDLHNAFDDLFHLYRLPQFIIKEGDRNVYGECIGWKELYLEMPWSGRLVDRALLYKVLRENGYMDLDLKPYWHYGVEKIKEFALATRGYREKIGGGELTEGEYRIDTRGRQLQIMLIQGVYPHNMLGITKSGRVVMINATGDLSKGVGMTIAQLQQEAMRKTAGDGDPVQDLFLLASGPDVIKWKEGRLIPEEGAVGGRLLQSALIAFTPAQRRLSGMSLDDPSGMICQSSL